MNKIIFFLFFVAFSLVNIQYLSAQYQQKLYKVNGGSFIHPSEGVIKITQEDGFYVSMYTRPDEGLQIAVITNLGGGYKDWRRYGHYIGGPIVDSEKIKKGLYDHEYYATWQGKHNREEQKKRDVSVYLGTSEDNSAVMFIMYDDNGDVITYYIGSIIYTGIVD